MGFGHVLDLLGPFFGLDIFTICLIEITSSTMLVLFDDENNRIVKITLVF